jgi:hypothetical protein
MLHKDTANVKKSYNLQESWRPSSSVSNIARKYKSFMNN